MHSRPRLRQRCLPARQVGERALGEPELLLAPAQRIVQVTHAVATKRGNFKFLKRLHGQEIIAQAGTLLGHDDDTPIVTPYDNCVLVMPSNHRVRAGVTIVRMGRVV